MKDKPKVSPNLKNDSKIFLILKDENSDLGEQNTPNKHITNLNRINSLMHQK